MSKGAKNRNLRIIGLYLFVLLIAVAVVFKIVKVQQFDDLINTSSQPRFFTVEAPRGNILSDDGSLLAISMPLYNIFLDMSVMSDVLFDRHIVEISDALSNLFEDKTAEEYDQFLRLAKNSKKNKYVRLQLKVTHNDLKVLKSLPIFKLGQNRGGLIAEQRPNRETPFGLLAQRTVGVLRDVNPVGIERAFNQTLSGVDGRHLKRKIAQKVWVPQDSEGNYLPKAGKDIVTTINIDMQDVAEKALERTLIKENADWGCVVLMEVETGEVKVIANLMKDTLDRVSEKYNYALAMHDAPGSTFKLASIIAGLEDGKFSVNDSVDLQRGRIKYYDRVMRDSPHDFRKVTIEKAFVISSNVGISKIINESYTSDPTEYIDRIYKMGLSTPLELELPYPPALKMPVPNKGGWSGITLPWMSTGYEMALSPLHMLTFYNAIANKGKMMNPIFTTAILEDGKEIEYKKPVVVNPSICSESTIEKIMPLLVGVVVEGTAQNIRTDKYRIAGKTGTTVLNYAGRKEGEDKKYQASFAGFFPADNPKYSCIVVVSNPKNGQVYGSKVAAPIFKELADKVYALDMDIHSPISIAESFKNLPKVKQGETDKTKVVLSQLNIDCETTDAAYMISQTTKSSVNLLVRKVEEDLQNGRMPSLKGMNLQDAVYLLETYGFSVVTTGSGGIVKQSIKKGESIKKGSVIKLELA
ncbi:MAG: penicillin-binding protein [Flavobacteriales bacterium]|nr:penicillin-binding protein [Flavobacteriales bacterium]